MRHWLANCVLAIAIAGISLSHSVPLAVAQVSELIDPRDDQFSVAYQINPAHTGAITFDKSFRPPLKELWEVRAEGAMSYPLIARGKIFIWVSHFTNLGQHAGRLYALEKSTGQVAWSVDIASTYGIGSIAYDRGRVFLVAYGALIYAFNADNGRQDWTAQMPGQYAAYGPTPAAMNGTLYTIAAGTGATVYGFDETTGKLMWSQNVTGGTFALSGDGLYVSDYCRLYKFDPVTGDPLQNVADCASGGGTVYYRGRVYSVGNNPAGILDANTLQSVGTFGTTYDLSGPALQGSLGYYIDGRAGQLFAMDTNGAPRWSFAGDDKIAYLPLVVNNVVYALSTSGTLFALDRASGKQLWSGNGGAIPVESTGTPVTGMAAGEGVLVVPVGRLLFALGTAEDE